MRKIPTAVKLATESSASTLTRVLKISLKSGIIYGICMTNKDVVYDDGDGELTYVATNSFDPSTFSSDIGYSVDNAEGYALISQDIPGVTVEMVEAGALDDGSWICYYLDYENPEPGSAVILDAGDLGQVRTQFGLVWIPELLSYAMRLRQPVGSVYSRTCRAIFGTPAAAQDGCGVSLAGLWQNITVESVGAETDRTFTGSVITQGSHPFYPGRVKWQTGANAGLEFATESVSFDTSGIPTVTLGETTPYPIQPNDTATIRPDCAKTKAACVAYGNYLNMKAEDLIPVGDTAAISVPGAQA